jgi:hypothetical protein
MLPEKNRPDGSSRKSELFFNCISKYNYISYIDAIGQWSVDSQGRLVWVRR